MKESDTTPEFPRSDPQSGRIHSERALFEEMERAAELLQSEQDFGRSGIRTAILACHSFLHVQGLSGQGLKPLINLLSAFESVEEGPLPEIFDPRMRTGEEPARKWSRSAAARETKIYFAACLDALMNTSMIEKDAASKVAKSVRNWPRTSVGMIKSSTVSNWRDELMQQQSSDRDRQMFERISRDFSEGPRAASYLKEVLQNGPPMTGGAGWPDISLSGPGYMNRINGPSWEDFPEGLRNDIDSWCETLASRRKAANGRTLGPREESTIKTQRRELVAAVRAAVTAGISLADLSSLCDFLHPDRIEIIIDHYWRKNGERPTLYTIDLATKFLSIARSQPGYPARHLDRLEDIRRALEEYRGHGLTEKNRALVRKVIQSEAWKEIARLPARMMAQARSCRSSQPVKAAVVAQLAVAIRVLTVAPVRMQNLVSIRLDTNLVRPGGPGAPFTLLFPNYDVKNDLDLEFDLDLDTTTLINEYIHDHRPHLMRGRNHDHLFPGKGQDCKSSKSLSEQISRRLWKHLGLAATPHQFRHAAAALILMREPGNYELVRRVLGHRNIQTTISFYVGLETLAATRRFGEIVLAIEAA